MRLERRRPRLHECEARKGSRGVESARFDAAEATALQAGTPAFQSHPQCLHRIRYATVQSLPFSNRSLRFDRGYVQDARAAFACDDLIAALYFDLHLRTQ